MRGDTAKVDGKEIQRLRANKEWTQQELARRIGCGKRLVQKLEAGGTAKLETIREFAEALEVGINDIKDNPDVTAIVPEQLPDALVQSIWVIARNIDKVDEKYLAEYLARFRSASGIKGAVKIISICEGSIIAQLEMTEEDTIQAVEAFCTQRLDKIDIVELSFSFAPQLLEIVYYQYCRAVRLQSASVGDSYGNEIEFTQRIAFAAEQDIRHLYEKFRKLYRKYRERRSSLSHEIRIAILIIRAAFPYINDTVDLHIDENGMTLRRIGIHDTVE